MGRRFLYVLGLVIGQGQHKLEDSKIAAIKSFPKACTKAQIRYFLGLTGYYRDFVSLPSLYIPVPGDVLYLQTDASGVGAVAVLSIRCDGKELPAAYYSRKLTPAEQNYSAPEMEGLAVVASINHFAVYLYKVWFSVEKDY